MLPKIQSSPLPTSEPERVKTFKNVTLALIVETFEM
jgi:hypothetical protein